MRRLSLIDRYLTKQIAIPLIGTLLLAAMLLVLDKMLRLFDFVVTAGGPVSVVWRMLANLLPEYFSLGIPIGLMLGILLAFRKLALSSELDALRGIGAGFGRLLRVPYAYAVTLMLLNLFIVGWLQPWTHYRLRAPALRPSLGRARGVDEGRRVQSARPQVHPPHRPERRAGHASFTASSSRLTIGRAPRSRRRRSAAVSCRPTIPTSSCSGWKGRASSRIRPSSRRRGPWGSTFTIFPSPFRASTVSAARA